MFLSLCTLQKLVGDILRESFTVFFSDSQNEHRKKLGKLSELSS